MEKNICNLLLSVNDLNWLDKMYVLDKNQLYIYKCITKKLWIIYADLDGDSGGVSKVLRFGGVRFIIIIFSAAFCS